MRPLTIAILAVAIFAPKIHAAASAVITTVAKVVGLRRVPEVRTLREKIAVMADHGTPEK